MDLDGYSRRAEAFTAELAREHYRRFAGLSGRDGRNALYERYADLFSRPSIEQLRAAAEASSDAAALLRFAVECHLSQGTLRLQNELSRVEAEAWIELPDGGRLRYRDAARAQAEEDEPGRRLALDSCRRAVVRDQLAPIAHEALERHRELVRSLGWPSYRSFYEQTTGIDLDALARQADALLRGGDGEYRSAIEAVVARRSPLPGAAAPGRADLPWLLARGPLPESSAAAGPAELLGATFTEMGLASGPERGLVLDVEERNGKSPRAFCAAVRVPGEVYLVLTPRGGGEDVLALMHEAGHAQHFAGTDPGLSFVARRLGDPAVGEAFAFLFEGLAAEPRWLRSRLGIDSTEALYEHAAARRLVLLRRYAAKLGFELALHGEAPISDEQLADLYSARLSAALAIDWPADTWLTDVDPGLYVVSYLRAWALEAGLRRALRESLGEAWFEQRRAGTLLAGLWRQGQQLSAEELLDRVAPGATLDLAEL